MPAMSKQRRGAWVAAIVLVAACGNVEEKAIDAAVDAAPQDGTGDVDGAPTDAAIDAAIDAPTDAAIDAPACAWITIAACDTGGTIAQFCPSGTHVNQLRRCNGTTYTPDTTYQQYHLCNCSFASCGCSGVAWAEVECCN